MNRRLGVIFSYLLIFVEALSTLLFAPYLLSTLGQAEYGVYKLLSTIMMYLVMLDMGVGLAVQRYMAKAYISGDTQEQRRFLGVANIYYYAIGLLTPLVGLFIIVLLPTVFAKGLTPEETVLAQKLLCLTTANAAITLGTAGYFNTMLAFERFAAVKISTIVQVVIRLGLDIVALKLGFGSIGVVSVDLALTVFLRIFYVLYVTKRLKLRPLYKKLDFGFIKEFFSFSSFVFLQQLAMQINSLADQVLFGMFVKGASVVIAVYAVGVQLVTYFQHIGSSVNNVLLPGVVRLVEKGADTNDLLREMVRIGRMLFMMLSLVWLVFLINGKTFVILWMGAESAGGYYVAAILMFAYIFSISQSIGSQILWAINAHKAQAVMQISAAILNVLLTIVLIQWNPLIGATVGTVISLFFGDVFMPGLILHKRLGIRMFQYYKGLVHKIDLCLLLTFFVGLVVKRFFAADTWLYFLINCAAMSVVYGASMLLFGMNAQEKAMISSIVRKFLSVFQKRKSLHK